MGNLPSSFLSWSLLRWILPHLPITLASVLPRVVPSSLLSLRGHVIHPQGFPPVDGRLISASTPALAEEALDPHVHGALLSPSSANQCRVRLLTFPSFIEVPRGPISGVRTPETSPSLHLDLPPPIFLPVPPDSSLSCLSQSPSSPLLPQGNIQHTDGQSPLSQRNRIFSPDPLLPASTCPPLPLVPEELGRNGISHASTPQPSHCARRTQSVLSPPQ